MSTRHEQQQKTARNAALATLRMAPDDKKKPWSAEAKAMHEAQRKAQSITGEELNRDAAKKAFSIGPDSISAARKILADHPDIFPKLLEGMTLKEAAGQANGGEGGQTQTQAVNPKQAPEAAADGEPSGNDAERLAEIERHPYSAIWGDLAEDKMNDLRADIETNGLSESGIYLYQGKVLDGWHRLRICNDLGRLSELKVTLFNGNDRQALDRTASLNLHRRQLSKSRLALLAAKASAESGVGRPADNYPKLGNFLTQGDAAKVFGVSPSLISSAKAILLHSPELVKAVESEDLSVAAAYEEIKPITEKLPYSHLAAANPDKPETPASSSASAWPTIEGWTQDELSPTADKDVYTAVLKRSRKHDQEKWAYSWLKVSLHKERTGSAQERGKLGNSPNPPAGQSKAQGGKRSHIDKDDPTRDEGDTGGGSGNQDEGSEESGTSGDGSGTAQPTKAGQGNQPGTGKLPADETLTLANEMLKADETKLQEALDAERQEKEGLASEAVQLKETIAALQSQLEAAPTDAPGSVDDAGLKAANDEIARLEKIELGLKEGLDRQCLISLRFKAKILEQHPRNAFEKFTDAIEDKVNKMPIKNVRAEIDRRERKEAAAKS